MDIKKRIREADVHDIFSIVVERMTGALEFHDGMANLYGFLCLDGYRKHHEKQFCEEGETRRDFINFVCSCFNIIPKEKYHESFSIIPDDWFKYKRQDVTPQIRKQAIEKSFQQYVEWESESKEIYEHCSKRLFELGCMNGFNEVLKISSCVCEELRNVEKMHLALKSVSFDSQYIQDEQKKFYKE